MKIVLAGDACGKTSLARRWYGEEDWTERHIPTLGVNCPSFTYEGTAVKLWDTGSGKYAGLRDGYYVGADGFVLMFDVTSRAAFEGVPDHANSIRNVAPGVPIVLCATQSDRLREHAVTSKELLDMAISIDAKAHFFVSGKSCHNFQEPLRVLTSI